MNATRITYGEGGYDPSKPNNNVVSQETFEVPPADANRLTIEDQASQALASNRAFLAAASPTNAQTLAQVKALTRQNNGLIRLLLHRLDGTD